MTEVNAVTTPKGFKLGAGPYAYSDPTIWPDWYLAQLLAGVADPKWDALTQEQKDTVQAENARRHPKSDAEAAQEAETRAATAAADAAKAAEAAGLAADVDAGAGAAVVASSAAHTRESDETILAGTVAEVSDYISKVTNAIELDALASVEEAGKNRAGVFTAIEKRRAELTAAATSSASPAPPAPKE